MQVSQEGQAMGGVGGVRRACAQRATWLAAGMVLALGNCYGIGACMLAGMHEMSTKTVVFGRIVNAGQAGRGVQRGERDSVSALGLPV